MRAVKRSGRRPIEIFEDESGRHRFRVRAKNGRILASSQAYAGRVGAHKGAASLRRLMREANDGEDSLMNEEKPCSRTN